MTRSPRAHEGTAAIPFPHRSNAPAPPFVYGESGPI